MNAEFAKRGEPKKRLQVLFLNKVYLFIADSFARIIWRSILPHTPKPCLITVPFAIVAFSVKLQ